MKIFLDDTRDPRDCTNCMFERSGRSIPLYLDNGWVVVRTYKDFCDLLHVTPNYITHISFDYDLDENSQIKTVVDPFKWFDIQANREYTGYDCAKFMKEFFQSRNLEMPVIYVHSMNGRGKADIISLFEE